jgi:hypothetical protein
MGIATKQVLPAPAMPPSAMRIKCTTLLVQAKQRSAAIACKQPRLPALIRSVSPLRYRYATIAGAYSFPWPRVPQANPHIERVGAQS